MIEESNRQQYNSFDEFTLPQEEWKTIEGTNDKYFISSFGRVVHLQKDGKLYIRSLWYDRNYLMVDFYQYGKKRKFYVHRLVAEYFCE